MKKKNGLLQTFFYDFLKIQVANWVREILVTFENQSSIIYWFLLRYTVIIYKFTQGNLGAKKIARSWFQSPVEKKNRKLRHWRPTARSLLWSSTPLPSLSHTLSVLPHTDLQFLLLRLASLQSLFVIQVNKIFVFFFW
jgi:hypothetical protein